MSRTINGKSVSEILAELSAPVKKQKNYGGYDYVKIEAYYDRMNSVLGVDHYSVSYDDEDVRTTLSGQELVSVKCAIDILDDNYDVVFRKEGYGATEIKYAKEGGRSDGLKNIPTIACSSAFKEACKCLGIFELRPTGFVDDDSTSKEPTKPARGESNGSAKSDAPIPINAKKESTVEARDVSLALTTTKGAEEVRKDRNTGKPVYRIECKITGGNERVDVLIYPNNYVDIEETIERLVSATREGSRTIHIVGDSCQPRNGIPQYIMKRLVV